MMRRHLLWSAFIAVAAVAIACTPHSPASAQLLVEHSTNGQNATLLSASSAPNTAPAQLPLPRPAYNPKIMVLGDSIAVDMAPAVRSESTPLRYQPYAAGVIGCVAGGSVMVGNQDLVRACFLFRAGWSDLVRRERPDVVVVMRQSLLQPGGSVPGATVCDPAYRTWFRARLREDVAALSVTGATVVLTTSPYVRFAGVVNVAADRDLDCANEEIRSVARTQHRAALVDLATWVCPNGACRTHHNGVLLRPDGLHFSGAGAQTTMRHLYSQIYK